MSAWADYEWRNPPPPFNPEYRPDWKERSNKVLHGMQDDGWYDGSKTRDEIGAERKRRYAELD